MDPKFRKRVDGSTNLVDSQAAMEVKKERRPWFRASSPEKVMESAEKSVLRVGGDKSNPIHVLSQCELQFGIFRGQTFKWVAENALGYAGYLVASMSREDFEKKDSRNHSENKKAFRKYIEHFPEGRFAIRVKSASLTESSGTASLLTSDQPASTSSTSSAASTRTLSSHPASLSTPSTSTSASSTVSQGTSSGSGLSRAQSSSLLSLLNRKTCTPRTLQTTVKNLISPKKIPTIVPDVTCAVSSDVPDGEMVAAAEQMESEMTQRKVCLPAKWIPALPVEDQQWISKALFKWSRNGQPELNLLKLDKLWWHPPDPPLVPHGLPATERYFGHSLFLWMPRKLWRVRLVCPHPDCGKEELTSAGLHQRVRQVVSMTTSYFIAAEYLACKGCKRKVISWSKDIVSQLDVGHQIQFPCLLTSKLGCDMGVVRQMRQRGLGNSRSQLQKQLEEQHAETWLQKSILFMSHQRGFARAASTGLVEPLNFGELPTLLTVPKHRWLMQVYAQDVLSRLDEIKASITSTFGRVLKIDSTKKIVRKLAGHSRGTAAWATNMGNEHGQIIMSVLTVSEGHGLGKMVEGVIKRYHDAGVSPPEVLYVDRDCCGSSHLHKMIRAWQNTSICLDIWHFMRRIAVGCTTDSHPLYAGFMNKLSHCIFMWDDCDLQALKEAKRAELEAKLLHPTDADLLRNISRAEMARHCKRTTRSSSEMETLISELIEAYSGHKGGNSLGVPLINSERMAEIWKAQKKHLSCLQDPPGVLLYMETGTIKKGGHILKTYRCATGSTSLESFHLHMNRFIPGTLASDTFFQAYLLDGLARWNEDRSMSAEGRSEPHSYSGLLRHAANQLSQEVLGKSCVNYTGPQAYTGELIGVEYLYNQTGDVLEDRRVAIAALETEDVAVAEDEGFEESEVFVDLTVPILETTLQTPQPACSHDILETTLQTPQPACSHDFLTSPASEPFLEIPAVEVKHAPVDDLEETASPSRLPDFHSDDTIPGTSRRQDSVGPDNTEGFRAVQDLAEALFNLREHSLALTLEESNNIVALWKRLSEHDKERTVFSPRHQTTLNKGRFRATKKIVAPGVESTKRCYSGARIPGQWPDCNRIVEAIFVQLCMAYPNPKRVEGVAFSRWTLIIRAYKHIRECILNNITIMEETTIQLPEVNKTTLTQWYCRRTRAQEKDILEQGILAPKPAISGETSQQSAPQHKAIQPAPSHKPYTFVLHPDTAGTAKLKIKKSDRAQCPPQPQPQNTGQLSVEIFPPATSSGPTYSVPSFIPIQPLPQPILPQFICAPTPSVPVYPVVAGPSAPKSQTPHVPYTTQQYRKRKEKEEQAGLQTRKYVKKNRHNSLQEVPKRKKAILP
ncbi:uncharacterized protein [Nothobranchius furzeri]|uniref:uncharacterized protein n=1 Tax=Nothobranchius furzeri TaxID=105023 RepID=UPI0039048567